MDEFKMSKTTYDPEEVPEMITLKEAASRTHLSYSTLRNMCLENQIVHFRRGNRFYVNYQKLIDFFNNCGA